MALLLAGLAFLPRAAAVQPLSALDPIEIYADGFGDLRGIVVDAQGNVYVADRARGAVTRIAPEGARTRMARGLERPIGLALDPAGRLLIAEEKAGRVVRVEANGSRTVVVSGVKQPRWLATLEDGTLFISARRLTRDTDPEPDDESTEAEMILKLTPAGQLHVFADGFNHLQGLAANHQTLFGATQGRRGEARRRGEERMDAVIFQIPILGDGTAGVPMHFGQANQFTKPVGLARDRLGALYLTTQELDLPKDEAKRAVAKLHPTGVVTLYAANLDNPQGVAFDADGDLYVADGHSGRVLRFRAPPAPAVHAPAVTNQSSVPVTGTTSPRARVDLFVNDAIAPVTVTADKAGAFLASIPLNANAANILEVFATTHGSQGLTSRPAETSIVHDGLAPTLSFQAPPAGAHVRGDVSVQVQASDPGSGLALLALTVDGQTLPTAVMPALPAAAATALATWPTALPADGAHTLGAMATDRAGNTATTTRIVLVDNTPPDTQITRGPSGPVSTPTVTFSFTGTDALTPTGSLLFAWRLDRGTWSEFGTATTASFTALAPGPHIFEVTARDLAGNEDPTPAQASFTVGAGIIVTITEPTDGATVPAGLLLVFGTVDAGRAEVGVTVNGIPAAVQGTLFAAAVPVTSATAFLSAVATLESGQTANHTIGVGVQAGTVPSLALLATPFSGAAPLTVSFSLASAVAPASIEVDFDGDGRIDFTGPALEQQFTYLVAGLYFPSVTIIDERGNRSTTRTVLQVYEQGALDAALQAKWAGFKSSLRQGDVETALKSIAIAHRDGYGEMLRALTVPLHDIDLVLRDIGFVSLEADRAEYQMIRIDRGVRLSYLVVFVRDDDGVWRLEFF